MTLGTGTAVASFDPFISGSVSVEHFTQPESSLVLYGVPSLQLNPTLSSFQYTQSFPPAPRLRSPCKKCAKRKTVPCSTPNPTLTAYYRVELQQPLPAGFGFGPNLRYLRIARNDWKRGMCC